MNGLSHRYKYTKRAIELLNVITCSKYSHLKLGEYSYSTSRISKTKFGRENKGLIENELNKAKNEM